MNASRPNRLAPPPVDDRLAREWRNRLGHTMSSWCNDLLSLRHHGGLGLTWWGEGNQRTTANAIDSKWTDDRHHRRRAA